jgi:hypothetical protein
MARVCLPLASAPRKKTGPRTGGDKGREMPHETVSQPATSLVLRVRDGVRIASASVSVRTQMAGEKEDGVNDTRPSSGAVRGWSVFTGLLVVGVFTQSMFAGLLLSGESWGRTAHGFTALALVAVTLMASVVAAFTLRGASDGGGRLAVLLFGLAIVLAIQTIVGRISAEGTSLLWLHVPLGVALVGFTVQPARAARPLLDIGARVAGGRPPLHERGVPRQGEARGD